VNPLTGVIDEDDALDKVTSRTRAIIAVNWTGRSPDYVRLRLDSRAPVIEDAAHGPIIGDRETGTYTCFSFGPIKHLTTGDGGAVMTDNASARASMRLLRWYGLDRTSMKDFRCAQDIQRAGMKFHMNDISAAIGLANLPSIEETVLAHRRNAINLYRRLLPIFTDIELPPLDPESNYWVFPVLARDEEERDRLKRHLEACGVSASRVHSRVDRHLAYNFPNGPLPGLDSYDSRQLNVPCGWWLTERDIDDIVMAFVSFR
jgi:dTDP-4-amino-4,6-dideoxygalactose transaminase